mmetsp:Transcript_15885/g.21552  ORF Transcript_15885/g.21552 Transcript_15885/m.21552 type:complete len:299 (+) Transcript_15885:501-1397(+)
MEGEQALDYSIDDDGVTHIIYLSDEKTNQYRWMVIICTAFIDIFIVIRYWRTLIKMRMLRIIPAKAGCWKAGLIPKLIAELIICSAISLPSLDYQITWKVNMGGSVNYSLDSLMNIIGLLKSYQVLRLYWHYCSWNGEKTKKVAKQYDFKIDLDFAIKSELKLRPFIVIGCTMLVAILYIGMIIRTCELPFIDNSGSDQVATFRNLLDSMWLTIITMTTVGYGDMYPSTLIGRLFGIVSFIIGNVLISLIVVVLSNETEFSEPEAKAYTVLKKNSAEQKSLSKASDVIRTAMRLYLSK